MPIRIDRIIEGSDLHLDPGEEIPPQLHSLSRLAEEQEAALVLNGDNLNLVPWGLREWHTRKGSQTIRDFIDAIPRKSYVLAGNHDPYEWLCEVLRVDLVRVERSLDVYVGDALWHFQHGHIRSDWYFWRHFAPGLVTWMTEVHPSLWYSICRRFGWLPGTLKKEQGESERYTLLTLATHSAWRRHSEKIRANICIGHTHFATTSPRFVGRELRTPFADGGDLRDGTYLVISGQTAELCIL